MLKMFYRNRASWSGIEGGVTACHSHDFCGSAIKGSIPVDSRPWLFLARAGQTVDAIIVRDAGGVVGGRTTPDTVRMKRIRPAARCNRELDRMFA
jgi:hypothetical protein